MLHAWGYPSNDFWTESVLSTGFDSLETLLPQTTTALQIRHTSDTTEQILSRIQVHLGPFTSVTRWNAQDSLPLHVRQLGWENSQGRLQIGDLREWSNAPFIEGSSGDVRYPSQSTLDRWIHGTGAYPNGIDGQWLGLRARASVRSQGEKAPVVAISSFGETHGFSVGLRQDVQPKAHTWIQVGMEQNLSEFLVRVRHAQQVFPWKIPAMATHASLSGEVGDLQTRTEWRTVDTSFQPTGLRKDWKGLHQIRSEWTLPWEPLTLGLQTESGWDSLEQIRLRVAPRLHLGTRWFEAHLSGRWSRRDTSSLAHLRTGVSFPLGYVQPWLETGFNPQDAHFHPELATGMRGTMRSWTSDVRVLHTTSGEWRWSVASEVQAPRKQLPFRMRLELERRPEQWNTRGDLTCEW